MILISPCGKVIKSACCFMLVSNLQVCEHIVNALSTGEPVPAPLTARMLKYKILRRRTADIAAKEALLKVYSTEKNR